MTETGRAVAKLFLLRNQYGGNTSLQKQELLNSIVIHKISSKKTAQSLYTALLFMLAYPGNATLCQQAAGLLNALAARVQENESLRYKLYNSGITGTATCAAFGFEMVKWLRQTRPAETRFHSFEADDDQVQTFLSVIMPKAESEIFQDGNAEWKTWLKAMRKPGEDLLDQLIAIFDSSMVRPEVKDEIWNAIGINVEINLTTGCSLPPALVNPYYHKTLARKPLQKQAVFKPVKITLTEAQANQVIDCSRMILIRHLREIDPISFTSAKLVSYYQLSRGVSIALMEMVPERRHPIDSYMGYTVFKNGQPVAYAGSWILFNSGRIGLNVFPDYRGGENRFIFEQVLKLHARVYNLRRFTVDPYQVGKDNSDGIQSGAFWVYYHAGFRPVEKQQRELAEAEAVKIKTVKKYRSAPAVLKQLAQSRLGWVMQNTAVRFDATDLSRAYAGIITKKYQGNRQLAEKNAAQKLAAILQIKNYREDTLYFVLQNWAVFLLCDEAVLKNNKALRQQLSKLFILKATGSETAYIAALQNATALKKIMQQLVQLYAT